MKRARRLPTRNRHEKRKKKSPSTRNRCKPWFHQTIIWLSGEPIASKDSVGKRWNSQKVQKKVKPCLIGTSTSIYQRNYLFTDYRCYHLFNANNSSDFGTRNSVDNVIMGEKSTLYAACGDNTIYQVDLEYGKTVSKFTGHEDFIHCMSSL